GLILRKANAVLDLDISGKSQLALVKDVQKDPVRQIIEHIDLVIIRTGERVTVDIPVHLEGEAMAGTTVNQDANTLSIEADAIHIPERIVIDIEGKEEGFHLLAKDVELPTGSVLISDPEALVVGITSATEADLGSSEGDEGAVAVEAAVAAEESE
ncbi:MAG: 50S ribosomal protein L25, partial [Lacisediminihabitans sp.]